MRKLIALLLVAGSLIATGCEDDPADPNYHAAIPAQTFIDSVSINTRTAYEGTQNGNYPKVEEALLHIGFEHIRDGLWPSWYPKQHDFYKKLAGHGITATLGLCDLNDSTKLQPDGVRLFDAKCIGDKLDILRKDPALRKFVDRIENVNEPDIFSPFAGWPTIVRQYQATLRYIFNSEPIWSGIEIVGPSFATANGPDQVGNLGNNLDYGNFHPYAGGSPPNSNLLDYNFGKCRITAGNHPCQATEAGYHNALTTTSGHNPTSEKAAAVYIPRTYLEFFRQGVNRTDLYTLVDQTCGSRADPEAWFGLYDCNFNPKPVVAKLRDLLAILKPTADAPLPPVTGGRVFALSNVPDGSLRSLFLRHSATEYDLVLWRDVSVWDRDKRVDLAVTPAKANLHLARPSPITRYAPGSAGPAVPLGTIKQTEVSVGAEPIVLRITG